MTIAIMRKNIMRRHIALLAVFAAALLVPVGAFALHEGYIDRAGFDVTAVLDPAPAPGTDRYEFDRKVFRDTRALENSPRWAMAVNDVQTDTAHVMTDFSCAAGIALTPSRFPRLTALMAKASSDTNAETEIAKLYFKRQRPFLIDPGAICEPAPDVAGNFDYPSGHTTLGWTWATILGELLPDRAAAILARGRAYGESRIVCGVHNASAVEQGRVSAAATLSVVRASPAYQADFAGAREELARLRSKAPLPDSNQCQAESGLIRQDIFHAAPGVSR